MRERGESGEGVIFRDVSFVLAIFFAVLVVLMIAWVNPEGQAAEDAASPGNVIVEISWPNDLDIDVDLWVKAPRDIPVGYSNLSGAVFNLLRDDLGSRLDPLGLNYESAFSRGIPSGQYAVNVFLYGDAARLLPVPVRVSVSVKKDGAEPARRVIATEVHLERVGQELTVARFELDDQGRLVPGSLNDLPIKLRSPKA